MNTAILIPAYEPDERLINMVHELSSMHFPMILVINDGSSKRCEDVFTTLEEIPYCTVIHHNSNKGKGAALKTGFRSIINMTSNILGCITVDADGQHLAPDILKTANVFEKKSDALVLGCRNFNAKNIPAKSRFGNLLTRTVFKLSTGKTITDTQTGLRAIPMTLMRKFLELPGEHYEFEMNMLMQVAKNDITVEEVEIQTVYINENETSHFNPLLDSARIYKEILKFSFSSLTCSAIDIGLFSLVYWLFSSNNLPWPLLGATFFARLISSGVNFTLNKKIVFKSNDAIFSQAVKYYLLCCIQMLCSWLLLEGLTMVGLKTITLLKIFVDTFLFFISFSVQRIFIFERRMSIGKNM